MFTKSTNKGECTKNTWYFLGCYNAFLPHLKRQTVQAIGNFGYNF